MKPSKGPNYRFGPYTLEAAERKLRREDDEIPLRPRTFETLLHLVQNAGHLLPREDLLRELWPDVAVTESSLNHCIQEAREALGDSAAEERYIETVRGAGYRFVGRVEEIQPDAGASRDSSPDKAERGKAALPREAAVIVTQPPRRLGSLWFVLAAATIAAFLLAAATLFAIWAYRWLVTPPAARLSLSRVTVGEGLQMQPSWSPDGKMLAYASDQGGDFDVWVRSVAGGDAVRVTRHRAHDWQPDWSPQGDRIVFRSERLGGGLFVGPVLGGAHRRLTSFGYHPRWSPAGDRILFYSSSRRDRYRPTLFLAKLDESVPVEVRADFLSRFDGPYAAAWHPDGERVSVFGRHAELGYGFWTLSLRGDEALRSRVHPRVQARLEELSLVLTDFRWSPRGDFLYFQGYAEGVVSEIWRISIDPVSLAWIDGPMCLTTNGEVGPDLRPAPDGDRIAFSARGHRVQVWRSSFDLEAKAARPGESPERIERETAASPAGLFHAEAPKAAAEIWEALLRSPLEQVAERVCLFPTVSPSDGRLACIRVRRTIAPAAAFSYVVTLLSADGSSEMPLVTPVADKREIVQDWTADGAAVLATSRRFTDAAQLLLFPVHAEPQAEKQARVLLSHPEYDVDQARVSPDGNWLVFSVVERSDELGSRIFAAPMEGGDWIPMTESGWAGKPVWSPDGQAIFFIAGSQDFFNVWRLAFDPVSGKPVGKAFQATRFESPARRLLPNLDFLRFTVSPEGFFEVPILETHGDLYVLRGARQGGRPAGL